MEKMKARLIKQGDRYVLYAEGGHKIACTSESPYKKLSLKNCQAIERGYDLDELAEIESDKALEIYPEHSKSLNQDEVDRIRTIVKGQTYIGFKKGFQKCLELIGDKKFTEEDVRTVMDKVWGWCNGSVLDQDCSTMAELKDKHIQSLQQNEWEVEILMEEVNIGDKYTPDPKPLLDAGGCLVLRRVKFTD